MGWREKREGRGCLTHAWRPTAPTAFMPPSESIQPRIDPLGYSSRCPIISPLKSPALTRAFWRHLICPLTSKCTSFVCLLSRKEQSIPTLCLPQEVKGIFVQLYHRFCLPVLNYCPLLPVNLVPMDLISYPWPCLCLCADGVPASGHSRRCLPSCTHDLGCGILPHQMHSARAMSSDWNICKKRDFSCSQRSERAISRYFGRHRCTTLLGGCEVTGATSSTS